MSLLDALSTYPGQAKVLGYGTAGFRENVSLPLHSVFVKMGARARPAEQPWQRRRREPRAWAPTRRLSSCGDC